MLACLVASQVLYMSLPGDDESEAVLRSERYQGYVLTPHSFAVEEEGEEACRWSIGVFLRTELETVHDNRYFRIKDLLVPTRAEAR